MPEMGDEIIFVLMIGFTVFLLMYSLMTPTFGENRQAKKRLKKRLRSVRESFKQQEVANLLRQKYLRKLSPFERFLESLPGMQTLSSVLEQSGYETPAYRFILICVVFAVGGFAAGMMFFKNFLVALVIGGFAGFLPIFKAYQDRAKRVNQFEEELPEALDIMTRALRAGHPFTGTIQLVAEELEGPVAKELGLVFTDINYGGDVRGALLGLLARVPSVTVMAFVTAVLIQRESGGNLAELLERLTALVRSRFRFQRQVKVYAAQGKMSAWVLVLLPFILIGMMLITAPDYMPMLIKDPAGRKLVVFAFFLMTTGILWIRKIIRIEV